MRGSIERQVRTETQTPQPHAIRKTATPTPSNRIENHNPSLLATRSEPVSHAQDAAPDILARHNQQIVTQDGIEAQQPYVQATTVPSSLQQDQSLTLTSKRVDSDTVAIQLPYTREISTASAPSPRPTPSTGSKRKADLQDNNPQLEQPIQPVSYASAPPIESLSSNDEVSPSGAAATPQPTAKRPRLVLSRDGETNSNVVFTADLRPTMDSVQEIASITLDDNDAELSQPRPRRKPLSAKARGKQRIEDMTDAIIANATSGGRKRKKSAKRAKEGSGEGGRGRKRRDETPEDAESMKINEEVLRMAEVCDDTHIGKKSVRQGEIEAFELAEALKKREKERQAQARAEAEGAALEEQEQPARADATNNAPENRQASPEQSQVRYAQPETRIVNGEIVIVQSSLTLNRHAIAEAAREAEEEEIVEENDLTRRINAGTYMKREKRQKWDETLTNRFYDGLRMFGTDFEMISRLFVGRSRRLIKLKFTREERYEPERIKETLLGERIPVDMEELSKMTNTVYMDPQELEREMAADRKNLEEEQAKEKEAMDEELRKRAEEAAAESAAVDEDAYVDGDEEQREQEREIRLSQPKPSKKTGKTGKAGDGKKGKNAASKKATPKEKPNKPVPRSKAKSAKELAQVLENIENLAVSIS